jgi:hypothetical protein
VRPTSRKTDDSHPTRRETEVISEPAGQKELTPKEVRSGPFEEETAVEENLKST